MPTIVATVGAANANSFATHAEVNTYFEERLPLATPWVASGQEAVIIMAARTLESIIRPAKTLMVDSRGVKYYRARRQWTGSPATTTQRLSWPRVGMYDRNGNAIASDVIPIELKEAQAELAGQLRMGDRTLDNDVVVQGLSSLRAGSVSLSFKDGIVPQVLPDAVLNLLVDSWLTEETISYPSTALFETI
jgi:hypothetical protein